MPFYYRDAPHRNRVAGDVLAGWKMESLVVCSVVDASFSKSTHGKTCSKPSKQIKLFF